MSVMHCPLSRHHNCFSNEEIFGVHAKSSMVGHIEIVRDADKTPAQPKCTAAASATS
jgi:hypothetical protein